MDASFPREWREDAWLVAAKVFSPGYIGGWSAAEQWDLTEQVFRDVFVITTRRVKKRTQEIQGTVFRIKVTTKRRLFGTCNVWRSGVPVLVSDASRTLVDILDEPATGGGINHVAGIVAEYFRSDSRDDDVLVHYVREFGNGAVFKRLGYLIETLGVDAPEVVKVCLREKTTGISDLDQAISGGSITRRWNLRIGVQVAGHVD